MQHEDEQARKLFLYDYYTSATYSVPDAGKLHILNFFDSM